MQPSKLATVAQPPAAGIGITASTKVQ